MSKGIQIYLKHHNDKGNRFQPRDGVCTSDAETHRVGCGQAIRRFVTYPREKGIYFDGEPVVIEQFAIRGDGAVIAIVATDNVHFATCPVRKDAARVVRDGKAAGVGGRA